MKIILDKLGQGQIEPEPGEYNYQEPFSVKAIEDDLNIFEQWSGCNYNLFEYFNDSKQINDWTGFVFSTRIDIEIEDIGCEVTDGNIGWAIYKLESFDTDDYLNEFEVKELLLSGEIDPESDNVLEEDAIEITKENFYLFALGSSQENESTFTGTENLFLIDFLEDNAFLDFTMGNGLVWEEATSPEDLFESNPILSNSIPAVSFEIPYPEIENKKELETEITPIAEGIIEAIFSEVSLTLQIETEGMGSVLLYDDPIEESISVNGGDLLKLTTAPNEGWVFSHWEGDIEEIEDFEKIGSIYEFTVIEDTFLKAVFKAPADLETHSFTTKSDIAQGDVQSFKTQDFKLDQNVYSFTTRSNNIQGNVFSFETLPDTEIQILCSLQESLGWFPETHRGFFYLYNNNDNVVNYPEDNREGYLFTDCYRRKLEDVEANTIYEIDMTPDPFSPIIIEIIDEGD